MSVTGTLGPAAMSTGWTEEGKSSGAELGKATASGISSSESDMISGQGSLLAKLKHSTAQQHSSAALRRQG